MNTLPSRLVLTHNAPEWTKGGIAERCERQDNGEMPAAALLPIRVLAYGLDADLLETRELLLIQAGYSVHTATEYGMFRKLVAEARLSYGLCVLCHTVPEKERPALQEAAASVRAPLYQLTSAVSPEGFLKNVNLMAAH